MLARFRSKYEAELLESVVPFWLRYSLDREFGGYFTCLDRKGQVYDTRKYLWLQGRAVWMWSRLYNEVERRPEWLEAARLGASFVERHALDPGGRSYFSLTREGLPVHFQRKPYATAFVAQGLLEFARATGDRSYQSEAADLFWRIRSWIEFPGMLGRLRLDGSRPVSKLADVMISGLLAMEFWDALADRRYWQVMDEVFETAMRHADRNLGVFLEEAAPNGVHFYQTPEGRLFCPGHSIEVAWLLLRWLCRAPNAGRQEEVLRILEGSLELGWDCSYGGLYYFVDVHGKPPLQLEANMKLWWPHTEAIYAVALAYVLTGDTRWAKWLEKLDEYVFGHFVDGEYGEWFGYCDRIGVRTNDCKGNHYKGMYHVPRALLFSIQTLGVEDPCGRT